MTVEKPAINSGYLFRELSARLKKDPSLQQRIVAHVREVSGHQTLPAFVNNGATEEQKIEVLSDCLRAIMKNDFSKLKGGVAKGQAPAPPATPTETVTVTKIKSFKVGVKEKNTDAKWVYNAIRLATADEAKAYGSDLFGRWMGISCYEVHESEDEPIHKWVDGKLIFPEEHKIEVIHIGPPTTETATTPQDEPAPPITITPPPAQEPAPQPAVAPPAPLTTVNVVDPKLLAVMEALKGLVTPVQSGPSTHMEEHINAIIHSAMKDQMAKLEQYIQGAVQQRVKDATERIVAVQIHEEVKTAKFELVQAIEAGQKTGLRNLVEAIAKVL